MGGLLGLVGMSSAQAASWSTYTQPFQNSTTSLSGQAVQTSTYFVKMDYWRMHRATLNLNFQISQLSNRQLSDLTVSLNGVKFYSFRPKKQKGLQTKSIKIPLRLLQGENELQVSGQILTTKSRKTTQDYRLAQTPANWLTIDSRSSVNCQYRLKQPTRNIDSFYDHFSGPDTIVNRQAVIRVPNQASNAELAASMYALTGEARVITTNNQQIPVTTFDDKAGQAADYQLIVATYDHLPAQFKQLFNRATLQNRGMLRRVDRHGKHYLVVTALTGKLLAKAARFVANSELMTETTHPDADVTTATKTFTSSLNYSGRYQLTTTSDKLTGAGHQEQSYFVSLPVDRNNADGSTITVHLRYARNLDFKAALATVYINGTAIGSHHLAAKRADNDQFTVTLPKGMALGNSFTVRIGLDLPVTQSSSTTESPWASIEPTSVAKVKSAPGNDLLFSNYPNLFLRHSTYDQLAVVRPRTMTAADYRTLTNIFNLIGNYAESNRGTITFYDQQPKQAILKRSNVIAFGTPTQNSLIAKLNSKLYFKFNRAQTGFISNEKLSIEQRYGQTLGTAQLLRSPFNTKRGLLVVTGVQPNQAYLASTQLNTQKNIAQYAGDAIVVDQNNQHLGYRFKKNKLIDTRVNRQQQIDRHAQLLIYLGIALGVVVIVLVAVLLLLRHYHLLGKGPRHD
ncbi:cellulose biosynthesis cyclic di-GMP-binding regulatory protein BcsB [Levilactobacillus andaensis]|uniref:cellulose biosynthesis cyclic di-GMP-binding regulatory protein BcsB n=1 Tax=Levilactobacillus andaensis TaxID=2799570 RepID=UPI001F1B2911|nr:cellulose biosynthesis cyclic di-GMP-binding regulatory protein BcsB [Levilactobacillus andaensis]